MNSKYKSLNSSGLQRSFREYEEMIVNKRNLELALYKDYYSTIRYNGNSFTPENIQEETVDEKYKKTQSAVMVIDNWDHWKKYQCQYIENSTTKVKQENKSYKSNKYKEKVMQRQWKVAWC